MSLQALKGRKRNLKQLADQFNESKGYQADTRFWKYQPDDKQNGEAIIRLLPSVAGEEETPFVMYKEYFIRSNNGIFACAAPENAGLDSFPLETAWELWSQFKKTNDEMYRVYFRDRMPSESFICNIYVVKDPANPENEGKVFLWKFGRQLKKKFMAEMGMEDDGYKPKSSILIDEVNPEPYDIFDLWDGANFYLTTFSSTGKPLNRSYERSKFMERKPLASDEELEKIYAQCYSLKEFVDPSKYPSYEELKKRYIEQTGDYYDLFPQKRPSSQGNRGQQPSSDNQGKFSSSCVGIDKHGNETVSLAEPPKDDLSDVPW